MQERILTYKYNSSHINITAHGDNQKWMIAA